MTSQHELLKAIELTKKEFREDEAEDTSRRGDEAAVDVARPPKASRRGLKEE